MLESCLFLIRKIIHPNSFPNVSKNKDKNCKILFREYRRLTNGRIR